MVKTNQEMVSKDFQSGQCLDKCFVAVFLMIGEGLTHES